MMKNTFIKKKLIAQGANRNLEKKKKKTSTTSEVLLLEAIESV